MTDFFDLDEEDDILEIQRPLCPDCFLELPVSGVCGACR